VREKNHGTAEDAKLAENSKKSRNYPGVLCDFRGKNPLVRGVSLNTLLDASISHKLLKFQ
jgi:hypothetical protein